MNNTASREYPADQPGETPGHNSQIQSEQQLPLAEKLTELQTAGQDLLAIERHGFVLESQALHRESGGLLYNLRHAESGARVFVFQRPEEIEHVGRIQFTTIPQNSSGVLHKLEHCLCAGEKGVEALFEMSRSLLLSDINAGTSVVHTVYYASGSHQDSVHKALSALAKLTLKGPPSHELFLREHGQLVKDPESPFGYTFRGIVHDEMLAQYAKPFYLLHQAINRTLFFGTPYAEDAGGDPRVMGNLSYREFCETYQSFYRAASAIIGVSGPGDLEPKLAAVAKGLEGSSQTTTPVSLPKLPPARALPPQLVEIPLLQGQAPRPGHEYLGILAKRVEAPVDFQEAFELSVVVSLFASEPGRPVYEAYQKLGLDNMYGGLHAAFPASDVVLSFTIAESSEREIQTGELGLREIIRQLAEVGFERELIEAELAARAQWARNSVRAPGLGGGVLSAAIGNYLRGEPTVDPLTTSERIQILLEKIDRGESPLSSIIQKYLLGGIDFTSFYVRPTEAATRKFQQELHSWLEQKIDNDRSAAPELAALRTNLPISEYLAAISQLPVAQITRQDIRVPLAPKFLVSVAEMPCECYAQPIGFPVNLKLSFDISDLSHEDVAVAQLLSGGIFTLGSAGLRPGYFAERLRMLGANVSAKVIASAVRSPGAERSEKAQIRFEVVVEAETQHFQAVANLVMEAMQRPEVNDRRFLTEQANSWLAFRRMAFSDGDAIIAERNAALGLLLEPNRESLECLTPFGEYQSALRFAQGIEQDPNAVSAQLASVSRQIFTGQNLRMALVAAEGLHPEILASIEAGITQFPRGEKSTHKDSDDTSAEAASAWKSGLRLTPLEAQNSFLGVAYKLTDVSGQPMLERQSLRIAATLLERHLWHEIRELGGAYGAFARGIPSKGLLVMGSDVDPDPSRSLAVMRSCAQFLRDVSTEDMITRAKVVVLRQYLQAKTPVAKAAEAFAASLAGIEQEEMDKRLSELFDVTPSDILLVADALERAVAAGVESVHLYGPEKALRGVTK